jgi:hypothetical protein
MEREITDIDAEIDAVLNLLDRATAKLGAMPTHITIEGWEELCEAKQRLEKLPRGLRAQ